jgi:RsiW-degrading membrane proteinase PrsW (M82 family)
MSAQNILAFSFATLFPLGFLSILASRNLYRTGKFYYNILTLFWGLAAYFLASYVNRALLNSGWASRDQIVRFAAPVIEEILKCLVVVYLVRRRDFVYIMDGIAYGFGAGIGFAVAENFEYIGLNPAIALPLAVSRVFSTNIMHATGTAIIGSALGHSRLDGDINRILFALGGLTFAIAAHMGFNNLVNSGAALAFAFLYAAIGAALIYFIVRYGFRKAAAAIQQNLGMLDGVTKNESAVVDRVQILEALLEPITEIFGAQETAKVKELIILQAQLGLQRENLSRVRDDALRRGIAAEVEILRDKVNAVRKSINTYCMLYVRALFPESNIPLWALIQQRVPATGTGRAGGGLWSALEKRTSEAKDSSDG